MSESTAISVKLAGDWDKLKFLISAAHFKPAMQAAIGRATAINALIIKREVRKNLKTGSYATGREKNRPLTMMIKGSSRALVDTGQLFQAITSKVNSWDSAEIGVARTSRQKNTALIVHEGSVVKVSAKMRALFIVLAEASDGTRDPSSLRGRAAELYARQPKGWKALKPSTKVIKIPPRPFIREVVESSAIAKRIAENWLEAASASIAGVKPKLRSDV